MDKDNIFKSCPFYLQAGDVVHVLIKDLTGDGFYIELNDAEGNMEDETEITPYGELYVSRYGALYNFYAITDVRNICPLGWHIAARTELLTLINYLDADGTYTVNDAGGYLKEAGITYWDAPNTGATNSTGFNGRGNGYRISDFLYLRQGFISWYLPGGADASAFALANTHAILYVNSVGMFTSYKYYGCSLRLIKDSTILNNGETGIFISNTGIVYPTICIGTQEWLACNLAETKYRDGTDIPIVTDNATWAALVTGAMCYYNNDISYA